MNPASAIILAIVAAIVSYLGILVMIRRSGQSRLIDIPNARSSHAEPTPSSGGLMIVLVTIGALLLIGVFSIMPVGANLSVYLASAGAVAVLGFVDDMRDLSFRLRILVQSAAAVLVIMFGAYPLLGAVLPVMGVVNLAWFSVPLAFIFIIGLTNAYNFMDGIDGIASLQAVITGFFLMFLAWWVDEALLAAAALLIGASSFGLLLHNWTPASIFMGDVGSTFLGFSFAVLIILLNNVENHFFVLGVLSLWPFIVDKAYTFLRRLWRRENVFEAHRSHVYQILVDRGLGHGTVSLLYGLMSLIGISAGLVWYLA